MKNCGQTVHDEVANKQTMEELKELLKVGALLGAAAAGGGRSGRPGGAAALPPALRSPGSLWAPAAGTRCRVRQRPGGRALAVPASRRSQPGDVCTQEPLSPSRAGGGFPGAGLGAEPRKAGPPR